MGDDTPQAAGTPARAITKSDPPDWVWVDEVLSPAEYAGQYPQTKWSTMLLRAPVDSTAKALGFYLALVVRRRTCSTFKSERTMALESGWSRSTVQKALTRLAALGWVAVVKKQGATGTVWLTWPYTFTPTGPPRRPVEEEEDTVSPLSTGPSLGPPLDRLSAQLDRLSASTGPTERATGPTDGPYRSLPKETVGDTERTASRFRQIRSEHFGGQT